MLVVGRVVREKALEDAAGDSWGLGLLSFSSLDVRWRVQCPSGWTHCVKLWVCEK